ncbi:hypothetical protein D3C76_89660 [compost metagenome]
MIQAIMNTVELILMTGVLLLAVYPYYSLWWGKWKVKGMALEMGKAYLDVLYTVFMTRTLEVTATLTICFFAASSLPKVGLALAIWFFQATAVIAVALRAGHKPSLFSS